MSENPQIPCLACRYQAAVCVARNESAEAIAGLAGAQATCACWIGAQGICFAVGYSTSDICVFGLPAPVQQGKPQSSPHMLPGAYCQLPPDEIMH